MNRFIIRVVMADRHRIYRMTGPDDITSSEKIGEMIRAILQDGGFVLDNTETDEGNTGEVIEVLEKNRYVKIDYLFLAAHNIDSIEVQHETIVDKHDSISNT